MFEWFFDGPSDLSEDQRSRLDDDTYVPQANSSTTSAVFTNNALGEDQILRTYESEPPLVSQVQVVVPTNYSNDNNEITYINKDGLKSDRSENPIRNPDGTYTDAEGHTIMADKNGNPIFPKDAPEYYPWFQPLKTDITENMGTVIVDAELVRNSSGQLFAVGTDMGSSLRKTLNDFTQGFSIPEKSPMVDTLLEAKKLNEGMKFLVAGIMLDDILGNKFSKAKETGRVEAKIPQSWSKVEAKGPSKAGRPSWRQSEKDVSTANPDYETQKSFKNGEEVPYGTKGSVRPDNYKEGASIEVKNYDVTTASGRNRLVDNITKQVEQRVEHLPADTNPKVVIDVRGQNISNDTLREIRDSIVSKTGENVEIQFLR